MLYSVVILAHPVYLVAVVSSIKPHLLRYTGESESAMTTGGAQPDRSLRHCNLLCDLEGERPGNERPTLL